MAAKGLGAKESQFFATILRNMKNKPDVDWEIVHKEAGYNSAAVAKERFRQIMKKLNEDAPASKSNGSQTNSPAKPTNANGNGGGRKKQSKIGSGTSLMAARVTKPSAKAGGMKAGKTFKVEEMSREEMKQEHEEMVKEEYFESDGGIEA